MKTTLFVVPLTALALGLGGCRIGQDSGELARVPGPPPAPASAGYGVSDGSSAPVEFDPPLAEEAAPPPAAEAVLEPLPEPEPVPEPAVTTYVIKKGDSFWKIAQAVYGDPQRMKDIEAANPGLDPKKLQIGDEIVLPE